MSDEWSKEDRERLVRVETELVNMKEYVRDRLESIEKATELAADGLKVRLESMNEVRAQLKDQAGQMMPRSEFTALHEKVCDDVKGLRESRAELSGKASQASVNYAYVLAGIGVALSAIAIIAGYAGG